MVGTIRYYDPVARQDTANALEDSFKETAYVSICMIYNCKILETYVTKFLTPFFKLLFTMIQLEIAFLSMNRVFDGNSKQSLW